MTFEMKLKEQYKEGEEAGKIATIVDLIKNGVISIEQGAFQLGVSEKQMTSLMATRSLNGC